MVQVQDLISMLHRYVFHELLGHLLQKLIQIEAFFSVFWDALVKLRSQEDGSWNINLIVLNDLKIIFKSFLCHLLNIIALCTSRSVDFL